MVGGLISRAKLQYPKADLSQVDLIEESRLNRSSPIVIGSCGSSEQK